MPKTRPCALDEGSHHCSPPLKKTWALEVTERGSALRGASLSGDYTNFQPFRQIGDAEGALREFSIADILRKGPVIIAVYHKKTGGAERISISTILRFSRISRLVGYFFSSKLLPVWTSSA